MIDIKNLIPVKVIKNPKLNKISKGISGSSCNGIGYMVIGEKNSNKILEIKEINHISKEEKVIMVDKKYAKKKGIKFGQINKIK